MQTTFGQITDIDTTAGTVTVRLAGDLANTTINLSLSSYTAVVGDKIALLKIGKSWAILGKLQSAA